MFIIVVILYNGIFNKLYWKEKFYVTAPLRLYSFGEYYELVFELMPRKSSVLCNLCVEFVYFFTSYFEDSNLVGIVVG